MTRDEILALEAGRELDALVAEKVMGQTVVNGYIFKTKQIACPDGIPGCCVLHYGQIPYPVAHYSTDIAAAWEVVEKLTPHNFSFNVCIESPPHETGIWEVTFLDKRLNTAYADTAPEAICKAALLAIMEAEC